MDSRTMDQIAIFAADLRTCGKTRWPHIDRLLACRLMNISYPSSATRLIVALLVESNAGLRKGFTPASKPYPVQRGLVQLLALQVRIAYYVLHHCRCDLHRCCR